MTAVAEHSSADVVSADPALQVEGSPSTSNHLRHRPGGQRGDLRGAPRRDAGAARRVRVRQVDDGDGAGWPPRTGRRGHRGSAKLTGRDGVADLLAVDRKTRRRLAGTELAIVFQDALTALNPLYTVGAQLAEPFQIHHGMKAKEAKLKAVELMARVGIPQPETRVDSYPHQFSGGMRQRLLIAMAVALNPSVLIADEPTTALDVTVQAQIMALLRDLRAEYDMAVVLITHDLALVAEEADRVAIMYAGNIVETGPVSEVFGNPKHPYTKGLLNSVPVDAVRGDELKSIGGSPPDLHSIPVAASTRPAARWPPTSARPPGRR